MLSAAGKGHAPEEWRSQRVVQEQEPEETPAAVVSRTLDVSPTKGRKIITELNLAAAVPCVPACVPVPQFVCVHSYIWGENIKIARY